MYVCVGRRLGEGGKEGGGGLSVVKWNPGDSVFVVILLLLLSFSLFWEVSFVHN